MAENHQENKNGREKEISFWASFACCVNLVSEKDRERMSIFSGFFFCVSWAIGFCKLRRKRQYLKGKEGKLIEFLALYSMVFHSPLPFSLRSYPKSFFLFFCFFFYRLWLFNMYGQSKSMSFPWKKIPWLFRNPV